MQYESELKLEAAKLATKCLDKKRADDIEETWVKIQEPIVFYRFDREAEEQYDRKRHHHCFICSKHFPLRSRPLLTSSSSRILEEAIRGVHGNYDDSEKADVCTAHLNLPNFDIVKSTYIDVKDGGKKIPDLTVGLLPWPEDWYTSAYIGEREKKNIFAHDKAEPFREDVVRSLEIDGYLRPLFAHPKPKSGVPVARVSNLSVSFPFLLWEAKKADQGDPIRQNAFQVKLVLEWQRNLAMVAKIEWEPLVFFIVSVGSHWKLYGCHVHRVARKAKEKFMFRLLWSGTCESQEEALQLLYLMDIIALWGQFQYKPFAEVCVQDSRREDQMKSLKKQERVDVETFKSLRSLAFSTGPSRKPAFKPRRTGTDTAVDEIIKQIDQGLRLLSIRDYFIPEKDGYIWLLHRELRGADLLAIAVNKAGHVLQPLIIFDSDHWKTRNFEKITRAEQTRIPDCIKTDFRYDKNEKSVLDRCFSPTNGYWNMSDIQFCAILPLKQQRAANDDTHCQAYFDSLEQLLGLRALVNEAQKANKLWCICQEPEIEDETWIQCDSTNCTIGWYHKACVDLSEDYEAKHWLCPDCEDSSNIKLSTYDKFASGEWGSKVFEGSDARIQRARSLSRTWKNHQWPDPKQVRYLMEKRICCEIEIDAEPHWQKTVESLEKSKHIRSTQCWAIVRDTPNEMTRIRRRFRTDGKQ